MPYDYEALKALFKAGTNNPEGLEQLKQVVTGLDVGAYEPGSRLEEYAKRCKNFLEKFNTILTDLDNMNNSKKDISEIEAYNEMLQVAVSKEAKAQREVREAEEKRKKLDDRVTELTKEEKELKEKLSRMGVNIPKPSFPPRQDEQEYRNYQVLEIQSRLNDIDNELTEDIQILKEEADAEIVKKKEAAKKAGDERYAVNGLLYNAIERYNSLIKFDLTETGHSITDYVGRLEHADIIMTNSFLMSKESIGPTASQILTEISSMPHDDPDHARWLGAAEYLSGVATALNGILVHNEKQTASRQIIRDLKELREIQKRDAANSSSNDGPEDENLPHVEEANSPQTKAKLKEILNYQVKQEDAVAEYKKLEEEEARLRKSIRGDPTLLAKFPVLKNGSLDEICEVRYTPSTERGTAFETETQIRQRVIEEKTETAAAIITAGITTPGYKEFIQDMIKLDLEQPNKGQTEFLLQYQQKGFSTVHKTVNGVDQEIQVNPQEVIRAIQDREPKKAALDEDIQNSVKFNEEDKKYFEDHKEAIEKYINLKTVQLKKAAIVQQHPNTVIQPIFQEAKERQYDESFQFRIASTLTKMNIARSTFWDTTEYKNLHNALAAVAQGTGDLTNLKNMAEAYINAKGASPRSAYGKARLMYAKYIKNLIESTTEVLKDTDAASKKAEQGLDQLGTMSVDQFLALHQAQEEMDILLSDPGTPLSPRQKAKAVENVAFILSTQAKQKNPNDAPTEAQIIRALFPPREEITKDLVKQALQKTPEQVKEAAKKVSGNVQTGLNLANIAPTVENIENAAWQKLNKRRQVEDSIARLLLAGELRGLDTSKLTPALIEERTKELRGTGHFKKFIAENGLETLRREILKNKSPRIAVTKLRENYFRNEREIEGEASNNYGEIFFKEEEKPLDTVAITKQNAEKAEAIRRQRKLDKIAEGKAPAGPQRVGKGIMKETELSVATFDAQTQYQKKSQIPANRLENAKFAGYIAIGDPRIDGYNSQEGIGRPSIINGFLKDACPNQPDEWYQDAFDTIMDLYYNNLTGDNSIDKTAFYSDFRDTFLMINGRMPGEMIGESGDLTTAGASILDDLLTGIEQYDAKVKQTSQLLGCEAPKTRRDLENMQEKMIIRKMLNMKQNLILRPEYYNSIRSMLDDENCTLDRRNFLISVDVPTLQKLSAENPTVEKFEAALDQSEVKYYDELDKKLKESMERADQDSPGRKGLDPSDPKYVNPILNANVRYSLRPSVSAGRGSSLRPSLMPGRGSVQPGAASGRGSARDSVIPEEEDVKERPGALPTIEEDEPQAEDRKSDASVFVP